MSRGMGRSLWGLILTAVIVTVLLVSGTAYGQANPEFRAMWVDCVADHSGLFSIAEINKLLGVPGDPNKIGDLREANCNAAIIEVRRAGKCIYDSALGEPWLTSFDALQAVLDRAHDTTGGKKRIEVHAWIVTFNTGGGKIWGDHMDADNPDNFWCTLTDTGALSSAYMWDPGHPKVQKYIVDVMMDLVTNYDVDGVHYDYIRFNAANEGYNPTSIARYNARHGTSGKPSPSDDRFDQWRRDQITGIVRQVYARIQAVKPHVLQSGSFVTWNPSPTASTDAAWKTTRPYGNRSDGVFSDWDAWMKEGIMDVGIPMNYYDDALRPADYVRWSNFIKDRSYNRHMVIGPALYKNFLSNNDVINQILATREPSPAGNYCAGFCGFSYYAPYVVTKETGYGNWDTFEPVFRAQVCPTWADIPDRPWKSNPTKGHISGSITFEGTGAWADGATVTISGPEGRTQICDGTGFYAFIDVTPGTYVVTASMPGYADAVRQVSVGLGQVTGNMYVTDMTLGATTQLVISGVSESGVTDNSATITWTTNLPADSQVEYGPTASYGSTTVLDPNEVTSHSQTLTGLNPATTYHYRVKSTASGATKYSGDYTFTTAGPPTITNVQAGIVTTTTATITWNTDQPSDSRVNYGTTSSYGQTVYDGAPATSHSIVLTGLIANTEYHFQCVSTNAYGFDSTVDLTFTTPNPAVEVIVDNLDSGWQSTGTGAWNVGSVAEVPKIGTNYLYYAGQTTPTRKCTWTPLLTVSGYYDVYAFYQKGTNRNTAARYTTYYSGGSETSIQDQSSTLANQGGWFLVAENKPFEAGMSGYLELTNESADTKYVSADAAKWVFKAPFDTTPPTVSISAPSVTLTKDGPVTFTITYDGADSITLKPEDISFGVSGTAWGEPSVSGSGTTTRTVTISSVTGDGTLNLYLAPGTASDAAGNLAPSAGPSQAFAVDNTAPAINSVTVTPAMAGVGDPIHVAVDATDPHPIASVTANGVGLDASPGDVWMGTIQAIAPFGEHDVAVAATDEAGNVATDTSRSYKSAQVMAALTEASWSPAVLSASGLFVFKFFGRVTEAGDDHFTLSDGSKRSVTVHAPGYKAKVQEGDYASARGIVTAAGLVESDPAVIRKY